MAQPQYQYDAFISYRHRPREMKIAAKLMQLLEKLSTSDKRRLHIFRDQSELPTSEDLGADIHTALEQSRFLIILGSPDYLQSKWCMEEVRYFRELHGGSNHGILPILIAGEPKEAFPECLFWQMETFIDTEGKSITRQLEIEPLCADVRGESDRESLKKLRNAEYLRLAAPILGCGYDDLYQRAQRQKRQRITLALSAVAAAAIAFAVYNSQMLRQINTRQQELYLNEARRLGTEALELSGSDPAMAMLLADTALPDDLDKPDRPIALQAEQALCSAVLQAEIDRSTEYFSTNAILHLGTRGSWELQNVYPEIRYFTVRIGGNTLVYDLINGRKILEMVGNEAVLSADGKKAFSYYSEVVREPTEEYIYSCWQSDMYYYDVESGTLLGSQTIDSLPGNILFDRDTGDCFVLFRDEQKTAEFCEGKFSADGIWIENVPMPDRSEERYRDAVVGGGWYSEVEDCSLMPDYWDRELTEQEIAQLEQMNPEYPPYIYSCGFTPDLKLSLFYSYTESDADGKEAYQTHFCSPDAKNPLGFCDGFVFATPVEGILLQLLPDELRILTYHPENFGNALENPEVVRAISPDGSLILRGNWEYWEDQNVKVSSDTMEPRMIKKEHLNYILPDLSRLLFSDIYTTDGNQITFGGLWGDHCCLNEDGTMVAFAVMSQDEIKIWDVEKEEIVFSEKIPAGIWGSEYSEEIFPEMWGDYIMLNSGYTAIIWNWKENCLVSKTRMVNTWLWGVELDFRPRAFQKDGLVLLKAKGLGGIYDLNNRTEVSFMYSDGGTSTKMIRDYVYCADTGILVVQCGDTFLIERRNEEGNFEVTGTIVTSCLKMKLTTACPALNEEYLVLNNGTYCEVYRVPEGELVCRIESSHGNAQYGLIGNQLVDLRILDDSPLRRFTIPTVKEARNAVSEYLFSEHGIRSLNQDEKDAYFIPSTW